MESAAAGDGAPANTASTPSSIPTTPARIERRLTGRSRSHLDPDHERVRDPAPGPAAPPSAPPTPHMPPTLVSADPNPTALQRPPRRPGSRLPPARPLLPLR